MSHDKLYLFTQIVKTMNITQTAARLGYSKAFVSKQLKQLERDLNVQLFERSTRKMRLTEIGQELYADIAPAMEQIQRSLARIEARKQKPQGVLRISAPVEFGQYLSQAVLPTFVQQYPHIWIDLELSPDKKELLSEHFDLLVRVGEVQDSSYIYRKIMDAHMGLFCAPQYAQRLKKIEDIRAFPWIAAGNEESLLGPGHRALDEIGPTVMLCRNLTSRMHMIASGAGIGLLPAFIFQAEILRGQIVPVLPEICSHPIPFGFIYAPQQYTPLKTKVFVEFVLAKLRGTGSPPVDSLACHPLETALE